MIALYVVLWAIVGVGSAYLLWLFKGKDNYYMPTRLHLLLIAATGPISTVVVLGSVVVEILDSDFWHKPAFKGEQK